jgi:protein-S-isoprenylcysteine O-methyltransferase Ste14
MARRVVILSIHLAAVLTPMALGWGFDDLGEFLANSARAALVAAIQSGGLVLLALGVDLNPLRTGLDSRAVSAGSDEDKRRQSLELALLAIASVALLVFLPHADRRGLLVFRSQALRWFGFALCCAGGLVRIFALRALGKQFSAYVVLQPGHRLVQSGIYAVVRHPLYLSLLLAGPGCALIFRSRLVWPILTLTAVFVLSRIRAEDALLAHTFADEFGGYRASTASLVPFLF